MKDSVQIGNKQMEMVANAATPFVYKQIFHKDLLLEINNMSGDAPDVACFTRLAFVMTKQGEGLDIKALMDLKEADFFAWLVDFEPMDFVQATGKITSLYFGQTIAMSVPKSAGE